MNAIRRFLLRNGRSGRGLFLLVFTVLLARAFLSGTVMLDPDAPRGSFGLVICSGSGPMLPLATPTASGAPDGAMDMSMDGMPMPAARTSDDGIPEKSATTAHALPSGGRMHPAGGSDGDTGGGCPFGAVFLADSAALVFLALFLGMVSIGRAWRSAAFLCAIQRTPYLRPLSCGPPSLA